jgi:hypothetical protein
MIDYTKIPIEIRQLVVTLITIGFAIAISKSDHLVLSRDGITITKTAYDNQAALESALAIIENNQTNLEQIKNQAQHVEATAGYCGKIADNLTTAQDSVSDAVIAPIAAQLATSEDVLN